MTTVIFPKGAYSADYSAYFVRNLAEYYLYTGDTDFVRQEWPIVAKELAWNASQVDANGLMATTNDAGADWDYYDGAKTGEVTAYNALYYQTLLDGAKLAAAAGHPELSAGYTTQAAALKNAINAALFNPATGVYDLSNNVRGIVAQDANVFAIVFGIAPANKVPSILAKIKDTLWTAHGTKPYSSSAYSDIISPFISGFELNARLASDNTADALTLLSNEWGPMIAPGDLNTGTFWENITKDGTQGSANTSMAHGWSTMPTSALSNYVLGIQPVDAGYKTWLVEPHPGDLAWTTGQAPTPHGALVTKWSHDTTARTFAMHVQAPSGTTGTIAVPTFGAAVDITVNGHVVWRQGAAVAGAQGVRAATLDGAYVDLRVDAGTYDIATAPAAPTSAPAPTHNRNPHAAPDTAKAVRNKATTIAVLKNDTDPDRDRLTIVSVKRPKHGKARIVRGKLVYKPRRGYLGRDVFTYTISDGHGGFATARVKVKVVRHRR
ncbi:Ig-like domain-containing protein [Nocardioides sp. Iso805N]|uniref:Ig-like domain-containing protein n=1 Tax=Nocardioides sp. Iso805N TaxID=1283287 RepID=UPI000381B340|nr:Ig-like domain-containing protein [Nocardioides sp. Iso805N]